MTMHWMVVADAAAAQIYAADATLDDVQLVDTMDTSHGRVRHTSHGHSDPLPGAGGSAGSAHHDPHLLSEEKFARAVAATIVRGAHEHRFERLILVAPPTFLGQIREELDGPTRRLVVDSVAHDWTRLPVADLVQRVQKRLGDTQRLG